MATRWEGGRVSEEARRYCHEEGVRVVFCVTPPLCGGVLDTRAC